MTIRTILSNTQFSHKKVLEKLIAHRLDESVARVLSHLDLEISDEDMIWIQTSYNAYALDKKPLEYILGYVEFLGYRFEVDQHTLIPRPETEYMITAVVQALKLLPTTDNQQPITHLIDVGTGCGVLGISCILHGAEYLDQAYLTEYYPETLEVARRNLESYKKSCQNDNSTTDIQQLATSKILNNTQLLHCSLLDHPVLQEVIMPTTSNQQPITNIIIVANLPYIPEQLFEDNVEDNVKLWEPKPAFVGGEDGLDWYREMLDQVISNQKQVAGIQEQVSSIQQLTTDKQHPITLFLEMMTWQVDILRQAYKNHFSFEEVATFHMNIRIVKVTSLS